VCGSSAGYKRDGRQSANAPTFLPDLEQRQPHSVNAKWCNRIRTSASIDVIVTMSTFMIEIAGMNKIFRYQNLIGS
jgi:hypothetical protein